MKRNLILTALSLSLAFAAIQAQARDTVANYPIQDALANGKGHEKVGSDIALYFAGQEYPSVERSLGEFATNKKTSAFGRTDREACEHVFLSAVLELQARARLEGGDAVVNIKSNYRNRVRESATEFTCGAGAIIAGAALKGEVVKLGK